MRCSITVIGGGLAGCEAAWQIANRGGKVTLVEMRPKTNTKAHKTDLLSELVCSNSLRSNSIHSAPGLLKEELRIMDSLIVQVADSVRVPAGQSLTVDRNKFSSIITHRISSHKNITVIRREALEIPNKKIVVIATGPLTSDKFSAHLSVLCEKKYLYFFDAISPIVDGESINLDKSFFASRYNKGGADYLNCPLTKEEYKEFCNELISAEVIPLKNFEDIPPFEACMPVEDLARRGEKTLLFGPMKPVGLQNPLTGKREYAIVQLRKENNEGTMYNIVGFQTKLPYKSQDLIFRKIPALKDADFLRYGSVHRNTYINSPELLHPTLQFKQNRSLFFCGQITGVEGYLESALSGLIAGINAYRHSSICTSPVMFPPTTCHGALMAYISGENHTAGTKKNRFQPMHINAGLFPPLEKGQKKIDKKIKKQLLSERAVRDLLYFKNTMTDRLNR